jgi:hypothetical protein
LEWVNDTKTVLSVDDLARTLTHPQASTSEDPAPQIPTVCKWQALLLLQQHLDHSLRLQYPQVDDLADLWTQLHSRFQHQQNLFLPQARTNWINLRVLDFPDFASFNSELHRITAQLRLCDQTVTKAKLIKKTLSTFPPATAILSQQYRNMRFKKHYTLMSHLLLAEKHHQLLLWNAESRPARDIHTTTAARPIGLAGYVVVAAGPARLRTTIPTGHLGPAKYAVGHAAGLGYAGPVPKIHAAEASRRPPRGYFRKPPPKLPRYIRNQPIGNQQKPQTFHPRPFQPQQNRGTCHKCGRPCHFARECRTPPYIVNMYRELQQSIHHPGYFDIILF